MRFIKASTTTRGINADTKGLNIDSLGLAEFNTDKAVIPPKGTQNQRPFTPAEGMLRYNTDVSNFEVYQNGAWKPIRFKEPITITQQNLGNGNGTETTFGPLNSGDSFYPVPISENNILDLLYFAIRREKSHENGGLVASMYFHRYFLFYFGYVHLHFW